MTAGEAFLALAAQIFGNWHPLPLLFGLLDAVAVRLQAVLSGFREPGFTGSSAGIPMASEVK